MVARILIDVASDLLERCVRASLLELASAALLRLRQVIPDATIMNRSRSSQELAIGADIDVPLSIVSEFATGEHAIKRWMSFPHRDMRRDAFAQQPCKQFAGSIGGISREPIRL